MMRFYLLIIAVALVLVLMVTRLGSHLGHKFSERNHDDLIKEFFDETHR